MARDTTRYVTFHNVTIVVPISPEDSPRDALALIEDLCDENGIEITTCNYDVDGIETGHTNQL